MRSFFRTNGRSDQCNAPANIDVPFAFFVGTFANIPRPPTRRSRAGVTFNFPLRDKNLLSAGDYFSPSPP